MPKLPRTSSAKILKALQVLGFSLVRQKGSHIVLRSGERGCVVPDHNSVAVGTLRGILRQAGISPDEFLRAFEGEK